MNLKDLTLPEIIEILDMSARKLGRFSGYDKKSDAPLSFWNDWEKASERHYKIKQEIKKRLEQ